MQEIAWFAYFIGSLRGVLKPSISEKEFDIDYLMNNNPLELRLQIVNGIVTDVNLP